MVMNKNFIEKSYCYGNSFYMWYSTMVEKSCFSLYFSIHKLYNQFNPPVTIVTKN